MKQAQKIARGLAPSQILAYNTGKQEGTMRNEGTIYERKEGKYKRIIFEWRDEDGKRHRKGFPATNAGKIEARSYQLEIMRKRETGYSLAPSGTTVWQWANDYIAIYKKPRLAPSSLARQLGIMKFLKPFRDVPLENLAPERVQMLYNAMQERGLSSSYISQVHKLLTQMYKKAYANKMISQNPMVAVDPPKITYTKAEILTRRDIGKIFRTVTRLEKSVHGRNNYKKYRLLLCSRQACA